MTDPEENVRPALASYPDLARMVDYAVLAPDASEEQVAEACATARSHRVGRLTVRPADLDLVSKRMEGSETAVGAVVSYPHAADTTSAKLYAVRDALGRGARAIETVLSTGKMRSRQFRYLESELQQMATECHRAGAELIVDFELGWLAEDLRVIACRVARRAEVDWVRGASLYGPARPTSADLAWLAAKLGEAVKVDAGPLGGDLDEILTGHAAGAMGFQTTDPVPLLEAWSVELKRRETAAAGVAG